MVYPVPYMYIYGTVRTPITLNTAPVPILERYTKGTVRYTLVDLQMCDGGIQKVKVRLARIADVEDEIAIIALVLYPAACHKVSDSLTDSIFRTVDALLYQPSR